MEIAIIGAGAAGLTSAHQALKYGLKITVFEKSNDVGGLWVYEETPKCEKLNAECQSPIYANMRTNLPIEIMMYRNFQLKRSHQLDGSSYVHHEFIHKYLESFTEAFGLIKYIKFRNLVSKVTRKNDKWFLVVEDLQNQITTNYIFDAIMVCNGHNSKPVVPDIPGSSTFPGHLSHSHSYRINSPYMHKKVLVIGGGVSGTDISYDCAATADQVIWSNSRKKKILHDRIISKPRVESINSNTITFVDGSSEIVDSIILCTGYYYNVPFLDDTCEIEEIDGKVIWPLYKDLININHPTMCFIGLHQKGFVFILMELQAEFFIKHICNKIQLPSKELMMKEREEKDDEKSKRNCPTEEYFYLEERLESYVRDLCSTGSIPQLPTVLFELYRANSLWLRTEYQKNRDRTIKIINDETFETYCPKSTEI